MGALRTIIRNLFFNDFNEVLWCIVDGMKDIDDSD